MKKQSFRMEKPTLIKIICCIAVIVLFWFLPPVAPLTVIGMRTIGVFIGTVLLLSLVDTVWPALLAIILLSRTGVMTLNAAISGSLGSWIIYFVIMSFIMTYALNESGFTSRLVAYYMSRKFVSKSPWVFTFSLAALGMLLGCFMDQVPAAAFMLAFTAKVFKELGYEPGDKYPHIMTIAAVFAVNIGGAMTPISHSLTILGLGIYEGATGNAISLFTYLAFGVPTGLAVFIILAVLLRLFAKPDLEKFKTFDVHKVIDKMQPMDLKEKATVVIFFGTVVMWMLPGILKMFIQGAPFMQWLDSFGITFWAILSVVLLSVITIDKKPIINLKEVVSKNFAWGIIIFISIGVLLGSAVSNESVGLTAFITEKIVPLTNGIPPIMIVLFLAFVTCLLTNFASNVTTITVMTGVGVAIALATGTINPVGIALTTTLCGCSAFMMPSSFATIAMLHGDEYSNGGTVIKYGIVAVVITTLAVTFIGYPLGCLIG